MISIENTIFVQVGKLCECDMMGATKLQQYAKLYLDIYNCSVERSSWNKEM